MLLSIIAIIVLFVVLQRFLLAPIALYQKHRTPVRRDFFPLTSSEIASCTEPEFAGRVHALADHGFEPAANLHSPSQATKVYTTILHNPETLERANVTEIHVYRHGTSTIVKRSCYMEISTLFTNGTEVNTNTSGTVRFMSVPSKKIVSVPGLDDASKLLTLHRRSTGDDRARKPLPEGGALQELYEGSADTWQKYVATGHYRLHESHKYYCPTVKGAIVMTLKLQQPIRSIRGWLLEREGQRLMNTL